MLYYSLRKFYSWLFIGASLLITIFLIINCFFSRPEADVYAYSYITRIYGLIGAQKYWYLQWSGRIIPSFILSTGEFFIQNVWAYQLISLSIILCFCYTIYAIVKKCFVFKSNLELLFTVAIVILTLTQMLASVSAFFYWLPASVTYTVPMIGVAWSLLFIFSKKVTTRALGFILLFLIATFNEIIDLWTLEFFVYLIVINYKNKELRKKLLFAFSIAFVGTLISFTAPGNFQRKGVLSNSLNLFEILSYSHKSLFTNAYNWLFGSPVLLLLLLLFLVPDGSIRIKERFTQIVFKNKALLYFSIYVALILPYLLIYKLTSAYPAERIINIISCVFLLLLVTLIAEWFSRNIVADKFFNPSVTYIAFAATLLVLYNFSTYSKNIRLIITDVASGKSKTYFNQYSEQLEQLRESTRDTVYVTGIKTIASSISFNTLNSDTSNYIYWQFGKYFNKKKIIVEQSLISRDTFE